MIANSAQPGPSLDHEEPGFDQAGLEQRVSVPVAVAVIGAGSLLAWAAIAAALKLVNALMG